MRRIYLYKLTVDAGAAPCVQRGLLSLAICKPIIRRRAKEGDLIFGFTANSLDTHNRLIYVARITQKLADGEYYTTDKYKARDDCIYEYRLGRFSRRKDAKFHPNPQDLAHDLGGFPDYPRKSVLLSADFRYFGANGTDEYKHKFAAIRKAVEGLGRGYRVQFDPALRKEFIAMEDWLWRNNRSKVCGPPSKSNSSSRRACYRSRYWAEV